MPRRIGSSGPFFLVWACALSLIGCASLNKPASARFASVTINGHTAQEICDTATAVFREKGYTVSVIDEQHVIFMREGTRKETIAFDGLVAAQTGEATLVRVRTELVGLRPGTYRLQCETFMVVKAGKSLEEEIRLCNLRSKPYQKLLDEVA